MKTILKSFLRLFLISLFLLSSGSEVVADTAGHAVYDMEKMWQIRGDDEELLTGIIDDAVVDENGRFYMLDRQLCHICVVDTSGGLIGYLGGEGEAPGEFRRPSSIAWWDDEMLAVAQASPGRLTLISTEGIPGGTIHYLRSGERLTTGIERVEPYSDGFIIQTSHSMSNGTTIIRNKELVRCDREGRELEMVGKWELTQYTYNFIIEEKLLAPAWGGWVCREDGALIWTNDWDQYSLSISRSIGLRESFACRDYIGRERSDTEVDSLKEEWESDVREYFSNVKAVVEKREPVITKLVQGPSGQIWVTTSRNHEEKRKDTLFEAEVHDPDGAWLGGAEILLPEGMLGGEPLVIDWPFVLARLHISEDGIFLSNPANCAGCVPVYAAFRLAKQ